MVESGNANSGEVVPTLRVSDVGALHEALRAFDDSKA